MEGVMTSETVGFNMKSLTHCQTSKARVGRLTMRRGQPVSLKTCENNLQANETIEVRARIRRKKSQTWH